MGICSSKKTILFLCLDSGMAFLTSLKVVLTFKREPSSPNAIIRFKAFKECRALFSRKISPLTYCYIFQNKQKKSRQNGRNRKRENHLLELSSL